MQGEKLSASRCSTADGNFAVTFCSHQLLQRKHTMKMPLRLVPLLVPAFLLASAGLAWP